MMLIIPEVKIDQIATGRDLAFGAALISAGTMDGSNLRIESAVFEVVLRTYPTATNPTSAVNQLLANEEPA